MSTPNEVVRQVVCPTWCTIGSQRHAADESDAGPTYAHFTADVEVPGRDGPMPVGLATLTDASGREVEPPTISLGAGELTLAGTDALIDAIRQVRAIYGRG